LEQPVKYFFLAAPAFFPALESHEAGEIFLPAAGRGALAVTETFPLATHRLISVRWTTRRWIRSNPAKSCSSSFHKPWCSSSASFTRHRLVNLNFPLVNCSLLICIMSFYYPILL
jgi:hypothetical protein